MGLQSVTTPVRNLARQLASSPAHAPINTSPPAVTMGPPRLIDPAVFAKSGGRPLNSPSGTCHLNFPVAASIAASVPHGGGLHGRPLGDRRSNRDMPYGVPRWRANSAPKRFPDCSEPNVSPGNSRMTEGSSFVGTISRPWLLSHAIPPQCIPPTLPGMINEPLKLGGVKIPSLRSIAI